LKTVDRKVRGFESLALRSALLRRRRLLAASPRLNDDEERWQSGRMRRFAKSVSGKLDRGFESPSLRLVDAARFGLARLLPRLTTLALAALLATGCVQRTLEIRTEPPGADVLVDSKYVGKSPVTVPFVYGGVHEVVLLPPRRASPDAPSFRPKIVVVDTESIAFDGPILDYFVDLSPIPASDRHVVDETLEESAARRLFEISPEAYVDALRERADALRVRARDAQRDARPLTPEDLGPVKADSRPSQP
jgi:hypothetical protein